MTKEEYLNNCEVSSAQELSNEQLLQFFLDGHGGLQNKFSAMVIREGKMLNFPIDKEKALSMLRQAFSEDKRLSIVYIEGETYDAEHHPAGPTHIEMELN